MQLQTDSSTMATFTCGKTFSLLYSAAAASGKVHSNEVIKLYSALITLK